MPESRPTHDKRGFMSRIFHRTSKQTSPAKFSPLPVELWTEILYWATRPRFILDTDCDPSRFHLFCSAIAWRNSTFSVYNGESRGERLFLRLVCRLWASIIDGMPERSSSWNDGQIIGIIPRIERLEILWLHSTESIPHQLLLHPNVTSLFLTFTISSIERSSFAPADMLCRPQILRNLRLVFSQHFPEEFLTSIQRDLPLLETFSLHLQSTHTTATLNQRFSLVNLRIFIFHQYNMEETALRLWNFPSIHSISFGDCNSMTTSTPPIAFKGFLERHCAQLRAFRTCTNSVLDFIDSWHGYPNLECLTGGFIGCPVEKLPLNLLHAVQLHSINLVGVTFYNDIFNILRSMPNLLSFTLPIDSHFPGSIRSPVGLLETTSVFLIDSHCSKHGIKLFDSGGRQLKSLYTIL